MKNAMLTPAIQAKPKKTKKHDVTPKDMAFERNFTKGGKPKLNATSAPKRGM